MERVVRRHLLFGESRVVQKTYLPEGAEVPPSQIGAALEALADTIAKRRGAGEESYTYRLLTGELTELLKKVTEEAGETVQAAMDVEALRDRCGAAGSDAEACQDSTEFDAAIDHLRYEAADVIYHLLVLLERYEISIEELAAELNNRMTDEERPEGAVRLFEEYVQRGK